MIYNIPKEILEYWKSIYGNCSLQESGYSKSAFTIHSHLGIRAALSFYCDKPAYYYHANFYDEQKFLQILKEKKMASLNELKSSLQNQPWFSDLEEKDNKVIAYLTDLSSKTLQFLPEKVGDKLVLAHYASSKFDRSKYVTMLNSNLSQKEPEDLEPELDISVLQQELQALVFQYNPSTVENVFFELHDGSNAITNISAYYVDLRDKLQKLYDVFGFDLVHEELVF